MQVVQEFVIIHPNLSQTQRVSTMNITFAYSADVARWCRCMTHLYVSILACCRDDRAGRCGQRENMARTPECRHTSILEKTSRDFRHPIPPCLRLDRTNGKTNTHDCFVLPYPPISKKYSRWAARSPPAMVGDLIREKSASTQDNNHKAGVRIRIDLRFLCVTYPRGHLHPTEM